MPRRQSQRNRPEHAGFTIIELLVTMFIAAILFAIAIPTFRGIIAGNRLVTQTNDLVGALTLARSEAITRNRTITFCRATSEAATTCAGSAGDWTFWILRDSSGQIARRGAVPTFGGVLRVRSNFVNDSMTYSSDGLARTGSPPALLNQTAGSEHTLTVCVNTTSFENYRTVYPGMGSRLNTVKSAGTC